MTPAAFLIMASLASSPVPSTIVPFPTGTTQTIHIVDWDSSKFPVQNPRTAQPPLTNQDLMELSHAGMEPARIVSMLEERRCSCDVSARGLVRLKKAGVSEEIISAASLHALAPNKNLELDVNIDIAVKGGVSPKDFVYFFVDDVEYTRAFVVSVADLMARRYASEQLIDRSDVLLEKAVRRVHFRGAVPLRSPGTHTLLVAMSRRPAVAHPAELSPAEMERARIHTFEYPSSSVQRECRLQVGVERDEMLEDRLALRGSRFECEWD